MSSGYASASNFTNRSYDPTALPPRWLDCPRKSNIIADIFIAFKTPLDDRFSDKISKANIWTCPMLISSISSTKKKLGLVIDLTNTDRFYNAKLELEDKGIQYKKIRCRGHGETPNDEQVKNFISTCQAFRTHNQTDIIGVHCTHGFNRSGFLICLFLYQIYEMSIDAALKAFADARAPGIYKQDYLDELYNRYSDDSLPRFMAPPRPSWCEEDSEDDEEKPEMSARNNHSKRSHDGYDVSTDKRRRTMPTTSNANFEFAVTLADVIPVRSDPLKSEVQLKCQRLCGWNRDGFPGSQPVSMDQTNYTTIVQTPYMVSWKADGTRYMMLIEDFDKIYMFDRDHNPFQIRSIRFPKDPDAQNHLKDTIVDGELVIDVVDGRNVPRYLIYDILLYEGESVMEQPFKKRMALIRENIVGVRSEAMQRERIPRSPHPFSIRHKEFYDLTAVPKLLGEKFRSQIAHEVDGLIFQPEIDPYRLGRSDRVFKWKEDNTIDFLLKITGTKPCQGMLPEKKATLWVNGLNEPFACMKYTPNLRQYDNKIIECSYKNNSWQFYRLRTDKSYPNARNTAFGAVEALKHPVTKQMLCDIIDRFSQHSVTQ